MNISTTNTLIGSSFAGTICFLLAVAFVLIGFSTRMVRARVMQSSDKNDLSSERIRSGFILALISLACFFVSYSTYAKVNPSQKSAPLADFLQTISVPPVFIFVASWILPCLFATISYFSIRSARWHYSQHNARLLFSRELMDEEKFLGLGFARDRPMMPVILIFAPALLGLPIFIYLFQNFGNMFAFVVTPLVVLSPYFAFTLYHYAHRPLAVYGLTQQRILFVSNCFDAETAVKVLSSSAQFKDYLDQGRFDRVVSLSPNDISAANIEPALLEALKRARAKQAKSRNF